MPIPATAVLEYRAADEQTWQTASLTPNEDGTLTATIAPVWIQSQNGASEVVHKSPPERASLQAKPTSTS